jgi:hypothetical protein
MTLDAQQFLDPAQWRIIDFAFTGFIFLGGIIVSLLLWNVRRAVSDIDDLKKHKADKDDISKSLGDVKTEVSARFDELAENSRRVETKIDANQRETTRLLIDLARNSNISGRT